jgi:ketosteroid isomerase-like protein
MQTVGDLGMIDAEVTRNVVTAFLEQVRFGQNFARVPELIAHPVLAHQVQSESAVTIERSHADFVEHVRELEAMWEESTLSVDEFLVDGARAFVRLSQVGRRRVASGDGRIVRQITSAVYHVEDGVVTEYWIQVDRAGLAAQLG